MQLEITTKIENKLLKRTNIEFEVKNVKATPTRKELRSKLAALANTKEELMVVHRIEQEFGSKDIKGTARAYQNAEDMKKLEGQYLSDRTEGKKQKKEEAPPAPPKKEEKKEEAKEEAKEETKAEEPKEEKKEGN